MRRASAAPLALPLSLSLVLHAGAVALLLVFAHDPTESMDIQPFMARLVAAPAGPREEGLVTKAVTEAPKTPPVKAAPVRKTPEVVKVPAKTGVKANTPTKQTATSDPAKSVTSNAADRSNPKAPTPQVAGGGPIGSTGSDVASMVFNGLEFPDQTYLNSIVSKIAKNFAPLDRSSLVAEFAFVINRRGCLQGDVKVVKSSNITDFDTEAKVAILKAGEQCGFNPLPAVWTDDILNIRFRFDPKLVKR